MKYNSPETLFDKKLSVVFVMLPKGSAEFQVNDLISEILQLQILDCLVVVIIKWLL